MKISAQNGRLFARFTGEQNHSDDNNSGLLLPSDAKTRYKARNGNGEQNTKYAEPERM